LIFYSKGQNIASGVGDGLGSQIPQQSSEDAQESFDETPLSIDDVLFQHLHGFGLIYIKESQDDLVLIISATPHHSFDLVVHFEDYVTLRVFGSSPPLEALTAASNIIGIRPEEWGFEPNGSLMTILNIRSPRPLVTDQSKIRRTSFPKETPLHHFFAIPFFLENSSDALHYSKLVIPTAPASQNLE